MRCDHSQIRKSPASLSQNWQNFNEESAPGFNNSVSHRRHFPTALEIIPQFHLRMQPAFQAHVDAAVSKTVNLPHDAQPSTVREIFMFARKLHLKGITVYRDGSRPGQTLSIVDEGARPDCRDCAV